MAPWCLRAAGPAPSPTHHRGHPAAPQGLKAAAAPATLGQTASGTAHAYNIGHKSHTAGLANPVGPATCQLQASSRAAPALPGRWRWGCSLVCWRSRGAAPPLPARQRRGCPVALWCSRAAAAPATLGQTASDTARGYNIGRKNHTAGLEDAADQSCASPECWPPCPSTIKLAAHLSCTGRSHTRLSIILLCPSQGPVLGDGTGGLPALLPQGWQHLPQTGIPPYELALASCPAPCPCASGLAGPGRLQFSVTPEQRFPPVACSHAPPPQPHCTPPLYPFPTPLRHLSPTSRRSAAVPQGTPWFFLDLGDCRQA